MQKSMTPLVADYFFTKQWLNYFVWGFLREKMTINIDKADAKAKPYWEDARKKLDDMFSKGIRTSWDNYVDSLSDYYKKEETKKRAAQAFNQIEDQIKKTTFATHYPDIAKVWKGKVSFWMLINEVISAIEFAQFKEIRARNPDRIKSTPLLWVIASIYKTLWHEVIDLDAYPNNMTNILLVLFLKYIKYNARQVISYSFSAYVATMGIIKFNNPAVRYQDIFLLTLLLYGLLILSCSIFGFLAVNIAAKLANNFATRSISQGEVQNEFKMGYSFSFKNEIFLEEFSFKPEYKRIIARIVNQIFPAEKIRNEYFPIGRAEFEAVSYTPTVIAVEGTTESDVSVLRKPHSAMLLKPSVPSAPSPMAQNPLPPVKSNEPPSFYIYTGPNIKRQVYPYKNGMYYVANFEEGILCSPEDKKHMLLALQNQRTLVRDGEGKHFGLKTYHRDEQFPNAAAAVMKLYDTRSACSAVTQTVYQGEDQVVKKDALIYLPHPPVPAAAFKAHILR